MDFFLTRFKADMEEKVCLQESDYTCYLCVLSPHLLVWALGSLLKAYFLVFFFLRRYVYGTGREGDRERGEGNHNFRTPIKWFKSIYMTAVLPLKDESSYAADTFLSDTSFILKPLGSLKVTLYLFQC